MLFTSFHFALFFPAVTALYFLTPPAARWAVLLAGGYYFCACNHPSFALWVAGLTIFNYALASTMQRSANVPLRRALFVLAILGNLAPLFLLKYYAFFRGAANGMLGSELLPDFSTVQPLGLSFFTLQWLGFTLDLYWKRGPFEPHFGRFALFGAFFPVFSAGPIERGHHLLPQFRETYPFDYRRVTRGLKRMGWGLIKKAVIADGLAEVVDRVYSDPASHSGPLVAFGILCYTYQIYCDFSGYSDLAIGAGQVLGFEIMENFDRPYAATSVTDFWRRWHIGLSSWFRDYVYVPLGGNRVSPLHWVSLILLVFGLSGLWHGAQWTFVLWGLCHGVLLLIQRWTSSARTRWAERSGWVRWPACRRAFNLALTFIAVALAWVLFRANSVEQALAIYARLPHGWDTALQGWTFLHSAHYVVSSRQFLFAFAAILLFEVIQWAHARWNLATWLENQPCWTRYAVYSAGFWVLFVFGVLNQKEFIYVVF